MGRVHSRTTRGSYGPEAMNNAMKATANCIPLKTAARQFGIPMKTLQRHRDG